MPNEAGGSSQPQPYRTFNAEEIAEIFTYHAPTVTQQKIYQQINQAFVRCASEVATLLPDGPGKTVAIRKLADARMACNAAVALEGRF